MSEERLYFQLFRRMMTAYVNQCINRLGVYEIHPSQAVLLLYLEKHEGDTQREIANALQVKPPTTATMISRMEKRGLVLRGQDETDKRKSRIYMTDHGKEICSLVKEEIKQVEQELNGLFTDEEKDNIRNYMIRLIEYLEGSRTNV